MASARQKAGAGRCIEGRGKLEYIGDDSSSVAAPVAKSPVEVRVDTRVVTQVPLPPNSAKVTVPQFQQGHA